MTSEEMSRLNVKDLSFINEIKSMVVVGPSKSRNFFFVRNHQENFKGDIYVVHPNVKSIPGFDNGSEGKIFKSIKEIPGDVDFAFIAVSPPKVLDIIDDCVEKGVKLATIFSAEFSDSGTKKGMEMEKELLIRAKNKVRILGPNGLGLYYPKLGIAWRPGFPTEPGEIGFIAQSGGVCHIAIYTASKFGISFSKVLSYGNGVDLDMVDLIYYLSNDPETRIILCYVEGIKEGRGKDLREVLALNKKPIIFLKGGQTKRGAIAARTHTASISGENHLWSAGQDSRSSHSH